MSNQKDQFNSMLYALTRIAHGYQSIEELREHAEEIGLEYEETLEMSYENIKTEAAHAIQGLSPILETGNKIP